MMDSGAKPLSLDLIPEVKGSQRRFSCEGKNMSRLALQQDHFRGQVEWGGEKGGRGTRSEAVTTGLSDPTSLSLVGS